MWTGSRGTHLQRHSSISQQRPGPLGHRRNASSRAPRGEREREQQAEAGLWALNGKARPVVCVAAATRTCPNHTAERAGGAGMQDTSQSAARPKAQRHTLTRTRTHAHRHTSRPKHTHPHATPTRAHGTTAHSTRAHTASRTYRAGRTCPRITPATRTQDTGSEGGASQHSPGSGRGALCPPPST